ncbi:NPC intracellular cholesterol transporter 2 homolog a [Venturia canescens]|uniref:NPC intracellular cholesterol transporter 2 homolog a n=1 Tax=Venturia canescens TaxID=32260 RepID=UPI001C9BE26B|nr:NPC intracellular cholesterol transporter 2 homolog a [Venturia canescens]
MLRQTFLVIAVVLVLTEATQVRKCSSARSFQSIKTVDITNCDKTPCKLKKNTKVAIVEKFIPDHDVKSLTTSVHAQILGVPLPFIGVDGTDACPNIYSIDNKKVGCPLQKDVEYVYKNEFPILPLYPTVSLVVNWALKEGDKQITCFEAPSKIV